MNKTFYLLAGILVVSMLSCNGQSNKNDGKVSVGSKFNQSGQVKTTENTMNATPIQITKADFLKLVMDYEKNPDKWSFQGEKPCIIDFYADWCAPCRITSPILEDLAK
jgi:thiol-disulfide isomerase/thioredoxin